MNNENFCPVVDSLNFFNRKWILCLLMDMFRGKKHFNEFKVENPSLNNYTLSQTLKYMEANGLIEKISYENKTEYKLSEKGLKVNKILYELTVFSLDELDGSKLNEKTKERILTEYNNVLFKGDLNEK